GGTGGSPGGTAATGGTLAIGGSTGGTGAEAGLGGAPTAGAAGEAGPGGASPGGAAGSAPFGGVSAGREGVAGAVIAGASGVGWAGAIGESGSAGAEGQGESGGNAATAAGASVGGEATGVVPAAGASGAWPVGGAGSGDLPGVPNTSEVFILPIPEILSDHGGFDRVSITNTRVGSVSASLEGDRALLYTNAEPSEVLTILETRSGADYLTWHSVDLINPIEAVFPAPDALHAIALLEPAPGEVGLPGFAVVPIDESEPPYFEGTVAPPVSVLLAPAPTTRGIVTVRDDAAGVFGAYLVRMPELQVDAFPLESPPTATGLVPVARRAFIAQEHVGGRITFIDLDAEGSAGDVSRTLTGFELEASVVGDASGRN
ncbi:MAG: hypothetical protein JW751_07715, partial [Polyangiaceae bacterium]|nr:hypothetical protein [Polyangiaceae bacterium]